jgi:hypothetical protein
VAPAWDEWERGAGCRRRGCVEPADVWLEGVPYCFADAEIMLKRLQAIEAAPSLRETLPAIEHRR